MFRRAALGAGLAACILVVGIAHREIPTTTRAQRGEQFVPRPDLARVAAFGFDALVADWYWLEAVQVVGSAKSNPARYAELLGRLVDVTTTLDPWVDHPYRFAAVWLTESESQVRTAVRLLERAVQYHPDDWRNFFYLGFDHFYYLDEDQRAARRLEQAAELPGSPRYLPRLVARLRSESGGLEAAEVFLRQMAESAEDEAARTEYLKALDELDTEWRARQLDAAREVYRRRNGRDIARVEDLVEGPAAVLRALPPEPHGFHWVLDGRGRIVSDYYGRRYRISSQDRSRSFVPRKERASADEG